MRVGIGGPVGLGKTAFSPELVDVYVIGVAQGEKIPRKGGPGIMQSDLLSTPTKLN